MGAFKTQLENRLVLGCISLLALTACNQDKLTPLSPLNLSSAAQTSVNVNFCTDPSYNQKQYLKTIIILDHSGSNQHNYQMATDGSGGPALNGNTITIADQYGTDPLGKTRYGDIATPGSLLNYLSTVTPNDPTDPTHFFALVDFSTQATTYPANSSGFTSDTVAFYNYVQQDATVNNGGPNDGGSTSYLSALTAAYNIMNSDIQAAAKCAALPVTSAPQAWCLHPGTQVASSYVIVMMSDGSPIINIDGIGVDGSGNIVVTGQINLEKESSTDILSLVGTISSLTSNTQYVSSVNLFTIYYYVPGNVDLNGQALLANMAKRGNGIGYNALSGSNIDYNSFQPPVKKIKYSLSDVFVTNASATWWTDGKLHQDTDMDGLPDDVEVAWGSDPLNAMTDNNGVSDLVKYFATNAKPCAKKNALGRCTDTVINYANTTCASLKRTNGLFPSSDPSGLNDCEKLILGDAAGINNPDSNSDLLPDWLEFKNGVPFQMGMTPAVNTPDQDGYSTYQKIKLSLPMNLSAAQNINIQPAVYNMTFVSNSDVQDCYQLSVTGLPVTGNGNTIRVDIIEKAELLQENYLYRVGKKVLTQANQSLSFNDWNDAAEKTAKTWSVWP